MSSAKIYQGIESRTSFVKAKPIAHGFGLEKRNIKIQDARRKRSLEPTAIDEDLPRVASLVSISKLSDNGSSLDGGSGTKQSLTS